MNIPTHISVGIMASETIAFHLHNTYTYGQHQLSDQGSATIVNNRIKITMANGDSYLENEILLSATNSSFTLEEVTIGIDFHWESKEQQTFEGNLKLIIEDEKIRAINVLSIDNYLCSVISSEMSATSSMQLLKAHTVISRSWLIAQILKSQQKEETAYISSVETETERIKWYDREDHHLFDVCADDHCQRYQGISRIVSPLVKEAVESTKGQVLMYDGKICDARFSKSCGGVSERFDNCWEPVHHPYLSAVVDGTDAHEDYLLDLTVEENAEKWILNNPDAFCNAQDAEVLKQVLNDYDQETAEFYRWKVEYTQEELSDLFLKRTNINVGQIIALNPLTRGTSGRIIRLEIVGTLKTFIIGKELEIRKALSTSHLYSSAFVVKAGPKHNNIPETFTLHGAGWGHGVGLCQIGAAVMADKGHSYDSILTHYFKGASLQIH